MLLLNAFMCPKVLIQALFNWRLNVHLTVETTRQFEIAFKMIDADGNDFVDLKEFSKVSLRMSYYVKHVACSFTVQVQEAVTRQRDNAVSQR